MGKITKKYIGADQVGSVQLELENALSLRAKSADGLSSVDLLEYSADNILVMQQSMYLADEKFISSLADLGDTFFIQTENSANISLSTNLLVSGNTGNIGLATGHASDGNSGSIFIETGTASANRGDIYVSTRDFNVNMPDSGEFKLFSDFGSGAVYKILFTALGQPSDAVGALIQNAGSLVAYSHRSIGQNDSAVGQSLFSGCMISSSSGGTFTGGSILLQSGGGVAAFISGSDAEISSGDVIIESIDAYVKGTGANANSGNVVIQTGAKQGTGVRGSITLDALEVQCSSMQFKDAADPTAPQDLATKAYVDAQIASGTDFHKEVITLTPSEILAQAVDLAFEALPQSVVIGVGQRVNLYEGLDYSLSIVGGVTQVAFIGPSATGGAEALVATDVLYIQYVKA